MAEENIIRVSPKGNTNETKDSYESMKTKDSYESMTPHPTQVTVDTNDQRARKEQFVGKQQTANQSRALQDTVSPAHKGTHIHDTTPYTEH